MINKYMNPLVLWTLTMGGAMLAVVLSAVGMACDDDIDDILYSNTSNLGIMGTPIQRVPFFDSIRYDVEDAHLLESYTAKILRRKLKVASNEISMILQWQNKTDNVSSLFYLVHQHEQPMRVFVAHTWKDKEGRHTHSNEILSDPIPEDTSKIEAFLRRKHRDIDTMKVVFQYERLYINEHFFIVSTLSKAPSIIKKYYTVYLDKKNKLHDLSASFKKNLY